MSPFTRGWLFACMAASLTAASTGCSSDAEPKVASDGPDARDTRDGGAGASPVDGGADAVAIDGAKGDPTDGGAGSFVEPTFVAARESLEPADIGVLVNADDPQSVDVGAYYMQARGIPAQNLISLHLGATYATAQSHVIASADFAAWKTQIDAATPANIQAYAVTWIYPSVVECMSLTSALAFGFDGKWCSATTCGSTALSPYYRSTTTTPYTTHAMRPAMIIAGVTTTDAHALIDRGVSADGTYPLGTGYAVRTSDPNRSVRYLDFMSMSAAWNKPDSLAIQYIDDSASGTGLVENKNDVLFYFTGLAFVDGLTTNKYLPGAIADHLTSSGGQIPQSEHMSIVRWLEAGATASFGTVVEPCNWVAKFPEASTAVAQYFGGATLIEAYWKSVAWPGEGLFIGEPLARPFGTRASFASGTLTVKTTALEPNKPYRIESAPTANGPWATVVSDIQVTTASLKTIVVPGANASFYRLAE